MGMAHNPRRVPAALPVPAGVYLLAPRGKEVAMSCKWLWVCRDHEIDEVDITRCINEDDCKEVGGYAERYEEADNGRFGEVPNDRT